MRSNAPVEIADQLSRKRAVVAAAAAIVFVGAQVLANPFFGSGPPETAHRLTPQVMWAVTATVTARAAVYVVVTASIAVALVTFSWLECRAHRDA